MKKVESSIKTIHAAQSAIYARFSDLSHLQTMKEMIPADKKEELRAKLGGKVSDFRSDSDSVSFNAMGMPVTIRIVDREPEKTIKFGSDNSPIEFNFWIQLIGVGPYETKMKLTLHADIPFYLKPMIGSKLEEEIEQIAEALTRIPY